MHYNNTNIQYRITMTLTTDVSVNLNAYTSLLDPLLFPSPILPPNNKPVVSFIDVKVKLEMGGGLSPVTVGEVHSPNLKN